ncbi:hypothetical protein LTS18_010334 [Coniosporium uncinatum]|uniref:Uncharacterized protein n=1 Tax=Coniosporium uncinatum TaxID=93489 RepID=A0ACC3DWQ4_9PEZI|nr:hypothetical protein LTS18_010334 [Coniosporium uncinatum]
MVDITKHNVHQKPTTETTTDEHTPKGATEFSLTNMLHLRPHERRKLARQQQKMLTGYEAAKHWGIEWYQLASVVPEDLRQPGHSRRDSEKDAVVCEGWPVEVVQWLYRLSTHTKDDLARTRGFLAAAASKRIQEHTEWRKKEGLRKRDLKHWRRVDTDLARQACMLAKEGSETAYSGTNRD